MDNQDCDQEDRQLTYRGPRERVSMRLCKITFQVGSEGQQLGEEAHLRVNSVMTQKS